MLEMRRKRPIRGENRPDIAFVVRDIVFPDIDHRLNADGHACPQPLAAPRLAVVRHLRVLMRRLTDTMPDQITHNPIPAAFGMALDRRADVPDSVADTRLRDPLEERFPRNRQQVLCRNRYRSDRDCQRCIRAPAVNRSVEV